MTVLVGLLLVGGYCGETPRDAMRVENRTNRALYLFYVDDDGRAVPIGTGDLRPGGEAPLSIKVDGDELECTPGGLFAESESGVVVARRSRPLCRRETWVIDG